MTVHNIKSWLNLFHAHLEGTKPFEYRKNDRDYKAGDSLHLEQYNQFTGTLTGRSLDIFVYRVWDSSDIPGLPAGYVIMSVGPLPKTAVQEATEILASRRFFDGT